MKRLLALLMMIALLGAFAAAENTQPVRILGASSYTILYYTRGIDCETFYLCLFVLFVDSYCSIR